MTGRQSPGRALQGSRRWLSTRRALRGAPAVGPRSVPGRPQREPLLQQPSRPRPPASQAAGGPRWRPAGPWLPALLTQLSRPQACQGLAAGRARSRRVQQARRQAGSRAALRGCSARALPAPRAGAPRAWAGPSDSLGGGAPRGDPARAHAAHVRGHRCGSLGRCLYAGAYSQVSKRTGAVPTPCHGVAGMQSVSVHARQRWTRKGQALSARAVWRSQACQVRSLFQPARAAWA